MEKTLFGEETHSVSRHALMVHTLILLAMVALGMKLILQLLYVELSMFSHQPVLKCTLTLNAASVEEAALWP